MFREQGRTIASVVTALSMTIATIVLAIEGVFGGGSGGAGGSPPKGRGTLKKWLDKLAEALKRLAGKAAEALLGIIGSVIGAALSFSWKGRWLCCRTYMGLNCFCCRTYCCMVNANI